MAIYRFGEDSALKEIQIHKSKGGGARAYLVASDTSTPEQLDAIKSSLSDKKLQWAPLLKDGLPVLEVRGFGTHEDPLLVNLAKSGAIQGKVEKQPTPDDKVSLAEKLKKNTLSASGYLYFIGDAGFMRYGWKEAFDKKTGKLTDPFNLLAGIFYAAGTPFIAFFGKGDKSDFQVKEISYTTQKALRADGIPIPDDSALALITNDHKDGTKKRLVSFVQRYPAEITNSIYGLAGAMITAASLKEFKTLHNLDGKIVSKNGHTKTSILMDVGLGLMTVVAGLISVFVQETPRDPDAPPKQGLARIGEWVREKPLRAAGGALMVSTISHAFSTGKDWFSSSATLRDPHSTLAAREKAAELKDTLLGRVVFVVTNLTAEVLMSLSSKGHGHGVKSDASLDTSLYAVMADMIHRQPEDRREEILEKTSAVLAQKKHLGGKQDVIKQGIREQLAALETHPWAASHHSAATTRIIPAAELSREHEQEKKALVEASSSPTHWQHRARGTATPAMQTL